MAMYKIVTRQLSSSESKFFHTTKRWVTSRTTEETVDDVEWEQAKPTDQIPGHRPLPVIGTIWSLLPVVGYGFDATRPIITHHENIKRFGHIWKDELPGPIKLIVYTAKPEDAEKLFRTEGKFPERPGFDAVIVYRKKRVEQYTSNGILPGKGEDWWRIRSKAQQPFLKTKNVEHYLPVLGDIAEEFIDRIRLIRQANSEVKPDFINEMYKWALESVAVVSFNTRLGCLDPNLSPDSEAQKMIDATNITFAALNEMTVTVLWRFFMTPTMKNLFQSQDFFTDTAVKYINKTLESIKNRPADSDEDPSILEEILNRGISLQDATVLMVDMLMAGIDTTAHTTSFLLYFLAKNPDKQEKLRNEILSVVGPRGKRVTPATLNELRYLKACIKESLRLRPALMANGRILDRNIVLSGFRVPKGTMVATLHQMIGQLDEYFPKAQEFIPERWIKGDPQESKHHPYALLPFGFGTKMCLGRRLAELEMWQLTIKILQHFRIEYHYEDIGFVSRLVNTPDKSLRFTFIDIKN